MSGIYICKNTNQLNQAKRSGEINGIKLRKGLGTRLGIVVKNNDKFECKEFDGLDDDVDYGIKPKNVIYTINKVDKSRK